MWMIRTVALVSLQVGVKDWALVQVALAAQNDPGFGARIRQGHFLVNRSAKRARPFVAITSHVSATKTRNIIRGAARVRRVAQPRFLRRESHVERLSLVPDAGKRADLSRGSLCAFGFSPCLKAGCLVPLAHRRQFAA